MTRAVAIREPQQLAVLVGGAELAEREARIEDAIGRGEVAGRDVAVELKAIRNEKLYRAAEYRSFEVYCAKRWPDWGARHVAELIGALDVYTILFGATAQNKFVEYALRPLTGLLAEPNGKALVRKTYAEAQKASGSKNPTAKDVKAVRPFTLSRSHRNELRKLELAPEDEAETLRLAKEQKWPWATMVAWARQEFGRPTRDSTVTAKERKATAEREAELAAARAKYQADEEKAAQKRIKDAINESNTEVRDGIKFLDRWIAMTSIPEGVAKFSPEACGFIVPKLRTIIERLEPKIIQPQEPQS